MSLTVTPRTERPLDLGEGWEATPTGLLVPPVQRRQFEKPIAIELFAGAGGMSCGLHMAGFHVIAALEYWETAAITYAVNLGGYGVTEFHFENDEIRAKFEKALDRKGKMQKALDDGTVTPQMCANFPFVGSGWISKAAGHTVEDSACGYDGQAHPDDDEKREWFHETSCLGGRDFDAEPCEHIWLWDASKITGEQLLEPLGLAPGEVDLVSGGPPCQGFSISGKRNVADPRNNLVFEFARLVCEIRPKAMMMENVPGIVSMRTADGRLVVEEMAAILERGDYAGYEATTKALEVQGGFHVRRGADAAAESDDEDPDDVEQLELEVAAA